MRQVTYREVLESTYLWAVHEGFSHTAEVLEEMLALGPGPTPAGRTSNSIADRPTRKASEGDYARVPRELALV